MSTPWLFFPKPNPHARLRLFCFPYAGGGASVYRLWTDALAPDIEVCAIQLPGRERRFKEAPFTNLSLLLQPLSEAIQAYLDKPFAFFGYSMGALISFELASRLNSQQALRHLFVAARRAAHLLNSDPLIHTLPDAEFIQTVSNRYQGIPEAVLKEQELLALFVPLLRADFTLIETHTYTATQALTCPITALGGLNDPLATQAELEAWHRHTTSSFRLAMLPGDHFFLQTARKSLLQVIRQNLAL